VFATVSRDGAPVADLQPYLGAFGYMVALRPEDLSYVRVDAANAVAEPRPTDRAGPAVAFTVAVPPLVPGSAGAPSEPASYRLFVEFRTGDVVRTADFTLASRAS